MALPRCLPLMAAAQNGEQNQRADYRNNDRRAALILIDNVDLFVSYRKNEDNTMVRLEAERKAGAKITHVTISSPLPAPSP